MSGTLSGTGTTTIGYTGQIVTETVTTTGYYDIVAIGAAGGATTGAGAAAGGDGAEIGGTVLLTAGETIQIAVGGEGQSPSRPNGPGGGGGGTFIVGPNTTPIVVAGGGGGGHYNNPGQGAVGVSGNGAGGRGGTGNNNGGGGGGGLNSSGTPGANGSPGDGVINPGGGGGGSFVSGAAGGSTPNSLFGGAGGFGGGGGAGQGGEGGGGGGYTGGDGGNDGGPPTAAGGTSYDSGSNDFTDLGVGTGNGSVTFTMHTAPTITGVSPMAAAVGTGTLPLFSFVQIGAETAALTVTATITLSSTTNGTLGNLGSGSLSGNTYTVVGTAAQDTAAIDNLTFTPTAGAPDTTATTTFTFNANDGVENAATMPTTTLTDEQPAVPIFVTTASQTVATTDEASAKPFNGVVITDANFDQTETAVVPVGTAANGSLSDPNSAADGSTVSNGTITIKGSATAVANDLDGLVFTPTAHQVAPGTVVTTTITATISDTAGQSASITSMISATAVNDAPVITVGSAAAGQTTQDTAAIKPFTTASVSDVDTGVQDSLTIVLSNAANGTLSGTGLTASSTAGTYTLAAAAPAMLTSELQALSFTPTAHEAAAGSTVTTTFALTASQTAGGSTVTSATNSTTSVIATETSSYNVINGPANGHAKIYGTSGNDQITAFSTQNQIYGEGGNDLINAGAGGAIVSLGNGNSNVVLGGSTNGVIGGNGNTAVTGGSGGYNAVALGNGNDTVTVGGTHDVIVLGTGTDMVSGTQGMSFITTGGGNDTIVLGGAGNSVNAGGGTNAISGGTGTNTFVLAAAGQGLDTIAGFTESNGDLLDLRAALEATSWNHQASTLANYLKVTDSGGNTNLAIAPKSSGSATTIATLTGTNYGLADLVSHHSLLTT